MKTCTTYTFTISELTLRNIPIARLSDYLEAVSELITGIHGGRGQVTVRKAVTVGPNTEITVVHEVDAFDGAEV